MQNIKCTHCKGFFLPTRKGHKFCSETCRKLSHKARKYKLSRLKITKRNADKVKKLATSSFGQYLCRELKRAGSVQVLYGHTSASFTELAELRKKCGSESGFRDGSAIWTYELSHIWPIQHDEFIGLLHPKNLVIASKAFNRGHGTKSPTQEMGLKIPRSELLEKWRVREDAKAFDVIKLARKYMGTEFDNWLKTHAVVESQKSKLVTKLSRAGFEIKNLKLKTFQELQALNKANKDEGDTTNWTLSKEPKDQFLVLLDELKRHEIAGKITTALELVKLEEWDLNSSDERYKFSGPEYKGYVEELINQAERLLHGQTYEEKWRGKFFNEWWVREQKPKYERSLFDDEPL